MDRIHIMDCGYIINISCGYIMDPYNGYNPHNGYNLSIFVSIIFIQSIHICFYGYNLSIRCIN